MENAGIGKKNITRLSGYKKTLERFKELGIVRVFSENLAEATGSNAAQIRKDFSIFGIKGHRRGGYDIETLLPEINRILGKDQITNIILVGAGKIGTALLNYRGFPADKINIIAAFDIETAKQAPKATPPILDPGHLTAFVRQKDIRISIIAVPVQSAQQAADLLVAAGITGILNFTPIALKTPPHVVVNNVHLEAEIENLIYFVNNRELVK